MADIVGDAGANTLAGTEDADVIDGKGGNDTLLGNGGNDKLIAGAGYDTLVGGEGGDELYFGADFSNADYANGGNGSDTLSLQGDYSAPLTIGAGVMLNMERLRLMSGNDASFGDNAGNRYSYNLRTVDAHVAAGQLLTLDASALLAGEALTFNGSAETNGAFSLLGGAGNDTFTAGAGDDTLRPGTGFDVAIGGGGNDTIIFGGDFGNADYVNGGAGSDTLYLQGNYATTLIFGAGVLLNVETLALLSGQDTRFGDTAGNTYTYDFRTSDANVASGQTLTVDFSGLGAQENVIFGGRDETNGRFVMYGGLGDDTLAGGAGDDLFSFGAGRWDQVDDTVDGGGGNDTLSIQLGAGTNSFSFRAGQIASVETVLLHGTGDAGTHTFVLQDSIVPAGGQIGFFFGDMGPDESVNFDGSAETDAILTVSVSLGGSDTVIGGQAADVFTLGSGDTLIYTSIGESNQGGADRISYSSNILIDLSRLDANTLLAGDQAFTFIGTSEFSGQAGELRFLTGDWVIRGDVNGDGISDFDIQIAVGSRDPDPIVTEQLFVL